MIKKIFPVLLVSISILYSQEFEKKLNNNFINSPVFFEQNYINSAQSSILFLSYKIPYNLLNFIKEQNRYFADVSVNVELKDKDDFIYREAMIDNCFVEEYNLTQSRKNYLEGVIKFNLPIGQYKVFANLVLNNSKNLVIPQITDLQIEEDKFPFIRPIFAYRNNNKDSVDSFRMTNFGNNIPFIHQDLTLIIPIKDLLQDNISIEIIQNNEICFIKNITNPIPFKFNIEKMYDEIYLNNHNGEEIFLFFIDGFNKNLSEGDVQIKVICNSEEQIFNSKVIWFDKPRSLHFPEFAIEVLAAIESEEKISNLFKGGEEKYYSSLIDYWKEMKPNDGYAFNEIMKEYYLRVDYALDNFSSFKLRNGHETDRGIIYIKYGRPDEIERDYSKRNDINEIWTYTKLNKQFLFVDQTGTGDYKLTSQK
ncbi:MAG: GWxTD domain-containing protein [Ignavibacteriales bacterium]|nr:GWxTD domain-containing protein [Ignavibacteriales bacterium]